ncbi:hypothetical protein NliqN6_3019 [Naganishia liquefaciens]|uniref:Rab-GAP TBC domain-containing protein n=1 Tax=Naganishia liquefaciens TaxID=104408 RepID=A0A8H3TT08_9TREE|nr:hypothetical protein NliqN6_3019 [Naganishia liquefaciens]
MTENPQDRDPDVQLDRSDTEQESRQMDITLPKSDILQPLDNDRSPSVRTSVSGGLLRESAPARELHISIPARRGISGPDALTTAPADDGQRDAAGRVSSDVVVVEEEDEIQVESLEMERATSSTRQSSASPGASFPAQLPASPRTMPKASRSTSNRLQERGSLASPSLSVFPQPTSPSPGREYGAQNPFSYDYDESPRSPLQWRQTFEDAVRASSAGYLSPVVGSLSHTPTPAPAYEGKKDSDGYFASRRGSQVGSERRLSVTSATVQENGFEDGKAVNGDERDQTRKGYGRNRATAVYTGVSPSKNPLESTTESLHGLGFGTPFSISASSSADAFESVSLDSNSNMQEVKDDITPSLPSSARSRSFASRLSLGNTANGVQSGSSSRRVSVTSVASDGSRSAARSPLPRKVSAGLWGDVGSYSPSVEDRRASETVKSRASVVNGHVDEPGKGTAVAPRAELREPTSNSRRPSVVVDDPTPKVAPTPRLQAPPAIPHDVDPALIAALSKPGASSLALAETGDPFLSRTPSSTTASHKRKSIFGIRTTSDLVRSPVTTEQMIITPASSAVQPSHAASQHGAGPSMLDQVRSQTRMVHLPPKSKEEDADHLERWKMIMEESRIAEEKRRSLLEQRRIARERRLAEDMPVWESEVLDPALNNKQNGGDAWSSRIRGNPKLRAMWFRGVPSHFRGKAWSLAIGNDLTLSKDAYRQYHSRANRAMQAQRFPADILETIEHDAGGTLPVLKIFQPGSPMYDDLKDLLSAWYVSRLDEGQGYIPDVHHLAGMLLITMPLPQAFIALRNLLNRPCLRAFYSGLTEEVEAYYRIFENLQGELFPKIYANCKHLGVRLPSSYFTTLFIHQLSFEAATRVWDVIILEGDSHIFRISLAILAILEPRLYFPDRKEIVSILEGSNEASLAIVARERERAKQKGLPYISDIDGVLTCLGVTEDALFETLEHDEWKESRFNRLCQRELPED